MGKPRKATDPPLKCLVCDKATKGVAICQSCRDRAAQIWQYERTLVACPNAACGWSPLEDQALFAMFPSQAAIANEDDLILLVFGEQGCHRCARPGVLPTAELYRLRPPR